MVDGVSGAELLAAVLDVQRDAPLSQPAAWTPRPEPSDGELIAHATRERVTVPVAGALEVGTGLRKPLRLASTLVENARAIAEIAGVGPGARPESLNGPIGPHRRYGWARGRLSDVKTIRTTFGGTVNDVILAAITNGFRTLLLERGEEVESKTIRSLVPVSVRGSEGHGVPDNRVSAMWAELPIGLENSVERLAAVTEQMHGLKESRQALGGKVLTSLGAFAPPMLLALGTRVAARTPQRVVNTVTTNVPGPQVPLYCWGRRVLEAYPYVPLGTTMRIGVAIFSYDGGIYVGVTGDYDAAPDIDVLCEGVEAGLSELVATATPATRSLRKKPKAAQRRSVAK